MVIALLACAGGGPDSGSAPEACGDPCALTDADNFAYTVDLDIGYQPLLAVHDDLVDWSRLTTDIHGHAVDAATAVDEVKLVVFKDLSVDEIEDGLATDTLLQADIDLYMICEPAPGETACPLSAFGFGGSYPNIDQEFTVGRGSWLFALTSADELGAIGLVVAEAFDDVQDTVAYVEDDTSRLDLDVDLGSLTPVRLGAADVVLDWSGLTVDGLGNPLALSQVDRLVVGRYDESPAELEASFIDLYDLAEETWTVDVSGRTSASLDELAGDTPFSGVDDASTWALALVCSSCDNPSPKFFTLLAPG